MSLTPEQISQLLTKPQPKPKPEKTNQTLYEKLYGRTAPEQFGPLRRYEKEQRCLHSGPGAKSDNTKNYCHSPTVFSLNGIPMCLHHAAFEMNEKFVEMGVDRW